MFHKDSDIIEDHPYENRKNGPQYMTPKYMQYMTPNTHYQEGGGAPHHAGDSATHHAGGGALHTAPQTTPHPPPSVSMTDTMPPKPKSRASSTRVRGIEQIDLTGSGHGGSYAHDDFGDEVADDYRV